MLFVMLQPSEPIWKKALKPAWRKGFSDFPSAFRFSEQSLGKRLDRRPAPRNSGSIRAFLAMLISLP